ncbi:hypothetical protein L208DRAFT_611030 [Tricholoma matsutake]|nr:hypothetical protein L208DRAFT_611030 [Tricholoma matsutake 945]
MKLKQSHDKLKRKALLAPNSVGKDPPLGFGGHVSDNQAKHRTFGMNIENNLGAVVGGVEASGVIMQRTPIVNRTMGGPFVPQAQATAWVQHRHPPAQSHTRNNSHRQPFASHVDREYRSGNTTDHSDSASVNEVENMLVSHQSSRVPISHTGWTTAPSQMNHSNQQIRLPQTTRRTTSKFRPAADMRS